ncbi:jhy protein homolog isoform X2 [Cottoperca gobio]|uniref:Jhy protein homolog isoform X2 n=1 Tax=Cottoperca gobio TaxID=56716 RepID=A0A6J2R2A6_COTGO|nr:jhy protein homolog isoform X2 [Cottoperca gobio]
MHHVCVGVSMVALLWRTDRKTDDTYFMKQTYNINMDKGLKHEKMSRVLKTEQEKHPSLRRAVLTNQWESVESDTESLAQEKAYQQQLQMHIGCHDQKNNILSQKKYADSLQQAYGEDEDANDDETEALQVYDSLDVAAHHYAKWNPTLFQTKYLDTQMNERGTSQLLTDDAYSDLRYDPNWRTNLREAGRFNESSQLSVEEYYQVPEEKSSQSCGDRQGYRYIVNTSPAVLVTPHMAGNESEQPYCLHPQDGHISSVTSLDCNNHALQLRSPEADLSKPPCIFTKNESDKNVLKGFRKKRETSCDNAGENNSRSPELTKVHAMLIPEYNTYYLQELRRTQGGPTQLQQMSISKFPKILLNKKQERLTEDIVERNKVTLGRNTSKCGSYVSVHALKQERPHNVFKVHESLKETASAENQEDSSDPKLEIQQLRVTRISEEKKAQQKEYPNHPLQQPPALGVKAEWGDCLSSHLLPIIQQRGQDDIINLASPHWSPPSEVELAKSRCQQTNLGKCQMSKKAVNTHLHHRNLENSPEQRQRTTALKWPSSCEGEDLNCPNEVHTKQFPQNLSRTPTTTLSLGSGSFTVLPPIAKSISGKEPEFSPGVNIHYPTNRSGSDCYLVQMEKQKQLKERVTYKAYSLKYYKQLKSEMNLQGLGPDYTAIEKTKMKRQKLYSNVIREQNKKISRIPFLLAKDPEGNDKKIPRMKALEYAKTIAKPPAQSQPKQRKKHQSEGFIEHTPYLEDLDVSQLSTLEVFRKRHEEEKQAVALFRKVHAV